jgi:hypothetical protein
VLQVLFCMFRFNNLIFLIILYKDGILVLKLKRRVDYGNNN